MFGLSPQQCGRHRDTELVFAGWLIKELVIRKNLELPNAQCLSLGLEEMVGAELTHSFANVEPK